MSNLSWPGVEHALAKAAQLLATAETCNPYDEARSLEYIAGSWRHLAEVAHALGYSEPTPARNDGREESVSAAPKYAEGGLVPGRPPYVVGEGGCTLTVPDSSGTTVSSGGNVTVQVDFTGGDETFVKTLRKTLREHVRTQAEERADRELLHRLRRIVRNAGGLAEAFGPGGDDGAAGVREPVRS